MNVSDENGGAKIGDVAEEFRLFYARRAERGLPVENPIMRMADTGIPIDDVKQVMLEMPFEKFERRHYFRYARDLAFIEMKPALWKQLKPEDLKALREACSRGIEKYYARLDT
ncbi:MAG: hypothetical protein AB9866_06570 [Syntrophobacteraceae bacterium]